MWLHEGVAVSMATRGGGSKYGYMRGGSKYGYMRGGSKYGYTRGWQ